MNKNGQKKKNKKKKNKMCAWMLLKSGKTILKWCRRVQTFRFSLRPVVYSTQLLLSSSSCCRCHHCYRRVSLFQWFSSTCVYWNVHTIWAQHAHAYPSACLDRPPARPAKSVSFLPLLPHLATIISTMCHAMYFLRYIWYTTVYMNRNSVWYGVKFYAYVVGIFK